MLNGLSLILIDNMKPKLILMVGPSGSGKSTFALEQSGFVYINQDLQQKQHLILFKKAIEEKKNVIVDRLNFSLEQRNRYLVPAKDAGYETEIIVLHESYDTCMKRCQNRTDHLSIKTQDDASNALNMFFSKYERVSDSEADRVVRKWPEGFKPGAPVIDLDGTLCNTDHRQSFVRQQKKDWKGFFSQIHNDTLNAWCGSIYDQFIKNYPVVFASGRPDSYRKETIEWLNKHGFSTEHLYMRNRKDSRKDTVTKSVILDFEILTRFSPLFFVDDRKSVIQMYRDRGFTVLDCAGEKGNF